MLTSIEILCRLCSKRLLPISTIMDTMKNINVEKFNSNIKYHSDKPGRNIIYIDNNISLHTLGFLPGQSLNMQQYGHFNVFFVVIQGEIIEYIHFKPYLTTRHFIHRLGNGHYINDFIGYHQFHNKTQSKTGILQLFVM